MDNNRFRFFEDKNIAAAELADLFGSVGWGDEQSYDHKILERSLASYPFVAYARDLSGLLVAYVSAFSDGAFSTFIGELAVRPDLQQQGLGTELLNRVERRYAGIPVYALSFFDNEHFFKSQGYRAGTRLQHVLFKIPA